MNFLKKILPHSLFGRSLMIILTPAILLQMILLVVFLDNHWKKMTMRYSESVAGEVALIVQGYKVHHQTNIIPRSLKSYFRMDVDLSEKNITQNKLVADGIWEKWVVTFLDDALSVHISDPYEIIYNSHDDTVTIYIDVGRKTVAIAFPDRRIFTSSSYIFLLWMVASALVLSLISIWFMRNQIRPIRKLAVAADRFGRGLDVGVFKASGAREVRQASHAFIVMRDRLQRQIDQRTTMLAGISHDLRTPLTRLKLGLSMIDSEDAKDMTRDVDEMDSMINGYLDFVRGDGDESVEKVDLSQIVEHVIDLNKKDQSKISYKDDNKEIRLLAVKPLSIQRCIGNLIRNSLKYAENVFVSIEQGDDYILIHVDDDGDGIPKEHRDDVFKAFYRLDKARNSSTGGVGLGLTITKDIALAHGGDILLSESSYGGLRATIQLPI
ncbi:MAG: HAMP domain-containing protein [Alphaproteobacteria bacterium]|nr:HAMP domain-containing protein [Alphaproteobacteria bacterium]